MKRREDKENLQGKEKKGLWCYFRTLSKKRMQKFECIQDSDEEVFIEEPMNSDVAIETQNVEERYHGDRNEILSSTLSLDEGVNQMNCFPTGMPFHRLKEDHRRTRSEDCNKNEMPTAMYDCLATESSLHDSFSKLKNIYDYQSSRFIANQERTSEGQTDHELENGTPPWVPGEDRSFDKFKDLYDRFSKTMAERENGYVSNTTPPEADKPVYL